MTAASDFPGGIEPCVTWRQDADCDRCGCSWSWSAVLPSLAAIFDVHYTACPRCGRLWQFHTEFDDEAIDKTDAGVRITGLRAVRGVVVHDPDFPVRS